MKHPDERVNKSQQEFLQSCPPEQQLMKLLLIIHANITYLYHMQVGRFAPSLQDYKEWLDCPIMCGKKCATTVLASA